MTGFMTARRNINPVKYAEGLADAITKHGGRIFENTRVRKFDNKEVRPPLCSNTRGHAACAQSDHAINVYTFRAAAERL